MTQPGDTVTLARGTHRGTLLIRTRIVLRGEPGAVIQGSPTGDALDVAAPGTVVEDLAVNGSGRDVMRVDSGVHVISCGDVILRRVRISGTLYGVYGERATRLLLEDCTLRGTVAPLDESGTGNGIHLWNCDSVRVVHCDVTHFLDAVYLSFANHAVIERSTFHDCGRYGFHTMYCQSGRLSGNRFMRNMAGCAIMFSNNLRIHGNDFVHNRGPRTYGLLLRDCSAGTFDENRLIDNTIAVFMDNSNRNGFRRNLVQDNGWGVLLFSSCANDTFAENNFIQNDYPVALDMRRTNNRFDDGTNGNYWSENAPYDLDGDDVSDVPYSPVSAFAFVSKQYPDLTILAHSPAVAALAVAERVFPALQPSEAVDHLPRVSPLPVVADSGPALPAQGHEPVWGAFGAFLGLGLLAAVGVIRGRGGLA